MIFATSPILKYSLLGISGVSVATVGPTFPRSLCVVDRLLEDRARSESEHAPPTNDDRLPGLRIAPAARLLVVDDEAAEAGHFDVFPELEVLLHQLEDGIDDLAR